MQEEQYRDLPPPVPSGPTNRAIASLVCGILSYFLCCIGTITAVVAVILGHLVLGQIKRGEISENSRGFAIAGLVLGYINLALSLLGIIIYGLVFAFSLAAGSLGAMD